MDGINETLRNVTSDVARLELEASDIQDILHRININSHRQEVSSGRVMLCRDSMHNVVDSSGIGCFFPDQQENLALSSALDSLTSQRREIAENLEKELVEMRCENPGGMSSPTPSSLLHAKNESSGNGHHGQGEKFQHQISVLEELDRQIGSLKSQLKSGSSSSSKSYSSSSTTTMHSALLGLSGHPLKRSREEEVRERQGLDAASSIISFSSSMEGSGDPSATFDQIGHKVEMVYSLLSMLSSNDRLESSRTLVLMSKAADTCELMRQSGCVSHLIQLLHPGDIWSQPPTKQDIDVLAQATEALHNLVHNQPDEKRKRRESRILKLLDQVRAVTLSLRLVLAGVVPVSEAVTTQDLCPAVLTLMRLSFDEDHRKATTKLGGLEGLAEMLISDHLSWEWRCAENSEAIRRYAGMALTNLTFGDIQSKHTLCSFPRFLHALNANILSSPEELTQVYSSVVRNLSWKADSKSKKALREGGCVTCLMQSAMKVEKESSLKSILSALWNLSAHCSENKAEICRIPKALEFLVGILAYNKSSASTTAVIENAGGILRNVSSHIAVKEEYRKILRERNCFQLLLRHLRSSSLTIVSNACGTLWNLSARSGTDQKILWELGAVPMLRSLIHSKHKNISLGSAAALKNLLSNQPPDLNANSGQFGSLMQQRKLKALECELDQQLAEVCEKPPTTGSMQDSDHSQSFMEGSGLAEAVSPLPPPSSDRRYSPGAQVVQMMDKLVHPVSRPSARIHASSVPPRSPDSSGPMPQSQSSQSLQRSDISLSSTKEEKMQQDKAAVHRYHNSLRRARRKLNQDLDECSDQPRNYANVFPEVLRPTADQDTVKAFCFEGTPQLSKSNSNTDLSQVKRPDSGAIPSPEKTKQYAVEGTPAEFSKSSSLSSLNMEKASCGPPAPPRPAPSSRPPVGVSNVPSPTFSRQSSVESLESCDQKSVRSHVPSVYSSHVPTGIVSPSELPDSPGRSSPPSPSPHIPHISHIPDSPRDSLRLELLSEREDAFSVASSLSALTIDSHTKIRTARHIKGAEEEPEYATFDRGRESQILELSIKSAVPLRRQTGLLNSSSADSAFKVPTRPPPRPSASSSQNCLKGDSEDTVRTFQYEGDETQKGECWNSGCPEPANSDSIRAVIKSAMPKPRSKPSQGKAVAIAKPMVRKTPSSTKSPRNSPRPQGKSPSSSAKKKSPAGDESAPNTSLVDCINMAMPKPRQSATTTPQKTSEARRKKGSEQMPEPPTELVMEDAEKGILEASGFSQLVASSGTTDSFLMTCSNATDLNDVAPPDGLMDISMSSCSLMRNSATSEKVKDASNLLKDSLVRQATVGSPKKHNSGSQCDSDKDTIPAAIKTSSEGSLSEDNYSRMDEDENFDISPEDIDLNLLEEDAKKLVMELEGGIVDTDEGELLIECETLSLVSSESQINDCESDIPSHEASKGPRITLPCPSTIKAIRGGGNGGKKQSPAPKMAVRTTKTAQLRAKRASESSNEASGSRTPSKGPASPRPDISRSGSNASDSDTGKVKKNLGRKGGPPPVPPKPKNFLQAKDRREKLGDARNPSPTSARISPFNYNKTVNKKQDSQQTQPSADKTSPQQNSKGSSKRMLVTTV